ncbi:hypothetical protein GF325_13640 [Candidatus Bathyarchaeota archaeon]|nr:hypothetical protein [Candidatus Bathyarchaeota archaeon]
MIFGISIINSSGFPYYTKDYVMEPKNIPLKMLFFDYSKKLIQTSRDSQFEMMAGLISAIFNFSKALNNSIGELVYIKPEFEIENLLDGEEGRCETGTLVTVKCESYCIKQAVKTKLDYIYHHVIAPLEPLSDKTRLAPSEEKHIQEILLNLPAKQLVRSHSRELEKSLTDFIKDNKTYGIQAVSITSEDLLPLKTVGISTDELQLLLRSLGTVPAVNPLDWKFRQAWTRENAALTLVLINSSFNVECNDLSQPLYYIIICEENAALGDLPRHLYLQLNEILYI